jgi:hypothetical protein
LQREKDAHEVFFLLEKNGKSKMVEKNMGSKFCVDGRYNAQYS